MLGYRPNRIEQLTIIHELRHLDAMRARYGSVVMNSDYVVHHVLTDRNSHGKMLVQIEYKQHVHDLVRIKFERVWV